MVVVLQYLAWIASALVWLVAALSIRALLMQLFVYSLPNVWWIEVVDKSLILVLLVGWLAAAIMGEGYYRRAVKKGRLLRQVGIAMGPALALVALAWLLGLFP